MFWTHYNDLSWKDYRKRSKKRHNIAHKISEAVFNFGHKVGAGPLTVDMRDGSYDLAINAMKYVGYKRGGRVKRVKRIKRRRC